MVNAKIDGKRTSWKGNSKSKWVRFESALFKEIKERHSVEHAERKEEINETKESLQVFCIF